tara:strand:- start:18340 stop:18930 length:591 start_codon:yes stop_codon:yes gene_type:complete
MAVGLPDVRSVAKSVMDKITGGYAAADEMPEEVEEDSVDITDEIEELARMVHHGETESPRFEAIIRRLQEHGMSQEQAIAAARSYRKAGEEGIPQEQQAIPSKILFDRKTGQIRYPRRGPKGTGRQPTKVPKTKAGAESPRPRTKKGRAATPGVETVRAKLNPKQQAASKGAPSARGAVYKGGKAPKAPPAKGGKK